MTLCTVFALVLLMQDEDSWSDRAVQLLADGNTGVAVELLQQHAQDSPEDALGWRLLARAYLSVADEWEASGGDVQLPLTDAKNAAQKAAELAPFDLEVLAAQFDVAMRLGEDRAAASLALEALGIAMLNEGAVAADWVERSARARIALFRAEPPASLDAYGVQFGALFKVTENAVAQASSDVGLRTQVADWLVEQGLPAVAAQGVEEALRGEPESADLHRKLIDICFYQGVAERLAGVYERLAESVPAGPVFTWYRGYVQLLRGDAARRERRLTDAQQAYARCERWMTEAAAAENAYAEGSRRIVMLANLGRAQCALDDGDLAQAQATLFAQLESNADLRGEQDGLQTTLIDAFGRLGTALEQRGEYAKGAEAARRVAEVLATDAQWWNNLGYFLREQATQVNGESSSDELTSPAAREVFRESWHAYQKAAELAPNDARIVNDAALIQVYHLREDLPLAERMLHQAIEVGETALSAMGEKPDATERFPVAQAVGDAYENLGYLAYHVKQDFAQAREFFTKAVATNSGPRTSATYLEALDHKREAIVEQKRATASGRGESEPAPRGQVMWEWSFGDALRRATLENRPIFVYYRGAGLGLSVPFLDQMVTSESWSRRSRAAVCVVADRGRHAIVDRRADGQLVPCPHFGGPSCSAHVAIDDEFVRWWATMRDAYDPETPEEGFYFFAPDGKRLDRKERERGVNVFEASAQEVGEPRAGADLDALAATLARGHFDERGRAAQNLWTAFAAGRARAETMLLDAGMPVPARRALIGAVAAADDPDSALLLEALVQRHEDEPLALLVLDQWPAQASAEVLRRVLDWSPFATVRARAAEVLGDSAPDDATQRVLAAHAAANR